MNILEEPKLEAIRIPFHDFVLIDWDKSEIPEGVPVYVFFFDEKGILHEFRISM